MALKKNIERVIFEKFGNQVEPAISLLKKIEKKLKSTDLKSMHKNFLMIRINVNNKYRADSLIEKKYDIKFYIDFIEKDKGEKSDGYIDENGNIKLFLEPEDYIDLVNHAYMSSDVKKALYHELSHLYDHLYNVKMNVEREPDDFDEYVFSRPELYADLSAAIKIVKDYVDTHKLDISIIDKSHMVLDEYKKDILKRGGQKSINRMNDKIKNYILKRAYLYFKDEKNEKDY